MTGLAIAALGAALAALGLDRLSAFAWIRHAYARSRGGSWYLDEQECPGCLRLVHVLRRDPVGGPLCTRCSSGQGAEARVYRSGRPPLSTPQDGPWRAQESERGHGNPSARGEAAQGRTERLSAANPDEGNGS